MSESTLIILKRLKGILRHWEKKNIGLCHTMSRDLIKFAWTFKLKNEVFMSEILEMSFDNIDNITGDVRFMSNTSRYDDMRKKITDSLSALIESYEKNDFGLCTEFLKEIRYVATTYQLDVTYEPDGVE